VSRKGDNHISKTLTYKKIGQYITPATIFTNQQPQSQTFNKILFPVRPSMGKIKNVYKILVGKPEGKRPRVRPRRGWEDIRTDIRPRRGWEDIRTDIRETG